MDLFKKKRGKGKSKEPKTPSKTKLNINQKVSQRKKRKKNGKASNKRKQTSRSKSQSSSDSDSEPRKQAAARNEIALEILNKKFKMAGRLLRQPADPPEYPRELMIAEYRDMFSKANSLTTGECRTLDLYMRDKAELRSSDHVVISEKVTNEEKKTSLLRVVTKYCEGRFGAIYIIQNESAVDDNFVSVNSGYLIMKTSLRNISSPQMSARLTREIKALNILAYSKADESIRRIPQVLFEGRVLGVPFFVTIFFDPNLEKCREEMGTLISMPSTFFIAQEILLALKYIHKKGFVHRDVKPTNIVLHPTNRNQWYLIDFGDTIAHGKTLRLCPPDGLTLPFLSREAHNILNTVGPSGYIQDIESWFYTFVDMIKSLPWKENNNIEEVQKLKKKFWEDLDAALPVAEYTAFPLQIAKIISSSKTLESPYTDISKALQDGYTSAKASEPDWKPDWIDRQMTAQLNKERRYRRVNSLEATTSNMEKVVKVKTNAVARICSDQEDFKPPEKEKSVYMFVTETKNNARTPREFVDSRSPAKDQDRSAYLGVDAIPIARSPGNRYRYKHK